jgi:hypothetical protein
MPSGPGPGGYFSGKLSAYLRVRRNRAITSSCGHPANIIAIGRFCARETSFYERDGFKGDSSL